jgi:uncharacterized protein (DUF2141 family)
MNRSFSGLFLIPFLVMSSQVSASAQGIDVTVSVSGLQSGEGQLIVCLWSNSSGFPDCNSPDIEGVQRVTVPPTEGAEVKFPGVAPGEYAVSVLHDLNSDGRTDTNFLGIPREPVGVSGEPVRRLGAPRFVDAKFQVSESTRINVELSQP